jgi:hypothetical protein
LLTKCEEPLNGVRRLATERERLHSRSGGVSATLNCGYGRGFSVLEVIDTVKRVAGVDFKIVLASRRAGDPAQNGGHDLQTIVANALAWERKLSKRAAWTGNQPLGRRRVSRLFETATASFWTQTFPRAQRLIRTYLKIADCCRSDINVG